MNKRMQLDSYLKKIRTSQRAFGMRLIPPVSQGQLSQWIKGKTRVTLSYALQINELSNGLVTPKDCAAMVAKSEMRSVKKFPDARVNEIAAN